jgi:hypothetical protein
VLGKLWVICAVAVMTIMLLVASTRVLEHDASDAAVELTSRASSAVLMKQAQLAHEAYLYAQPLFQTYARLYRDLYDSDSAEFVGQFNQLRVLADVASDGTETLVVNAWLDLRAEPLLLDLPAGGGLAFKVVDLFGRPLLDLSERDNSAPATSYLLLRRIPNVHPLPDSARLLATRSDLVHLHARLQVANPELRDQLLGWLGQLALRPLSSQMLHVPPAPASELPLTDWDQQLGGAHAFVERFNWLIRLVDLSATDRQLIAGFRPLGIAASIAPRQIRHSGAIAAGMERARQELLSRENPEAIESLAIIGQN